MGWRLGLCKPQLQRPQSLLRLIAVPGFGLRGTQPQQLQSRLWLFAAQERGKKGRWWEEGRGTVGSRSSSIMWGIFRVTWVFVPGGVIQGVLVGGGGQQRAGRACVVCVYVVCVCVCVCERLRVCEELHVRCMRICFVGSCRVCGEQRAEGACVCDECVCVCV